MRRVRTDAVPLISSALGGGDQIQVRTSLTPPPISIKQVAGVALQPVWGCRARDKSFSPAGNRTPDRPGRSYVPPAVAVGISTFCRHFLYMFGMLTEINTDRMPKCH
jgi:hypothetical protein